MSHSPNRADGDIVRDFLSVADLLEEPPLAQLYAYLARENKATVQDVMDDLELAQGTAYSYVNRLVDAGVVDVTDDEQPGVSDVEPAHTSSASSMSSPSSDAPAAPMWSCS